MASNSGADPGICQKGVRGGGGGVGVLLQILGRALQAQEFYIEKEVKDIGYMWPPLTPPPHPHPHP